MKKCWIQPPPARSALVVSAAPFQTVDHPLTNAKTNQQSTVHIVETRRFLFKQGYGISTYCVKSYLYFFRVSKLIGCSNFRSSLISTPNHFGFLGSLFGSKYLCSGFKAVGSGTALEMTVEMPTIAGTLQLLHVRSCKLGQFKCTEVSIETTCDKRKHYRPLPSSLNYFGLENFGLPEFGYSSVHITRIPITRIEDVVIITILQTEDNIW